MILRITAISLLQTLSLLSTPMPFFLFLETCLGDAVKKHKASGFLDTTVYQWLATAPADLPVSSATIMKQ